MGPLWTSDARYWLTADRSRAVPEGDPDAAFLLVPTGHRIPMFEAVKFGLVKKAEEQGAPDPANKMQPKPADKAVRPKANKGA